MANIKVINCLRLGAGKEYKRTCSIPQGCPWSMTVLALMTYPWISIVRKRDLAIPRVLADDLSLWASSLMAQSTEDPAAWKDRWRQAINLTLQYLEDMGGNLAHNKCLLLASGPGTRRCVRKAEWGPAQDRTPVTGGTRD